MQDIIQSLLKKGNYEDFDIDDICAMLQVADDEYNNDGELSTIELSDNQYDVIRFNARRLAPSHVYFTGVGSDERGSKVDLPNPMPSLEQEEIGDIVNWAHKHNLGDAMLQVTDKMDGTSIQMIYDADGELRIAYSRGNGLQGADVTRHVRRMKNVPSQLDASKLNGNPITIRAEVELSNSVFEVLRTQVFKSDGKQYKNPRNMAAGMMNKKESPQEFYDVVDIFTYEVLESDLDKDTMLGQLSSLGFKVVHNHSVVGSMLNDGMLAEWLTYRKENLDYDIDGVVITVNSNAICTRLDAGISGNTNPKSSVKYKVADASNYALVPVLGVDYKVSKHAFGKPVIRLEPFDIQGVTVSNTTGFNAKFIKDNMIGEGSILLMTRSGDVIPYVVKVNTPAEDWIRPNDGYEYEWNDTGVDLVLTDPDSHPEVRLQQVIWFATSLELPQLKEGSVRKLFEAGHDSIESILLLSCDEMVSALGKNGIKAYEGIHKKLSNIHQYELAGSTPFFGRGVGKRKFEELFAAGDWELEPDGTVGLEQLDESNIIAIKGFETVTANKIMGGVTRYNQFIDTIQHLITYSKPLDTSTGHLAGEMVCFTGFRDKDLGVRVEAAGGKMQSSVSGKTTLVVALDPNSTSGKVQKARDKGIPIVSPDQIQERILVG